VGTYIAVRCSIGIAAFDMMSLGWMAVTAAVLALEKIASFGPRLIPPVAALSLGLGTWVALSPGSVPGLSTSM